jgi:hypothetical protein
MLFLYFQASLLARSFVAYITWLDIDSTAVFHCLLPSIFTEIVTYMALVLNLNAANTTFAYFKLMI